MDGMCSCNRSRGYDELEQRYERLAEVARDMYRYMDGVLNFGWATSLPFDTICYRNALAELGVKCE